MLKQTPISLSIVILAYNEENYLEQCLQAVARQTIRPDEVIVVDNNSTDRTAEIACRYSFVRLVHEGKQGKVFARNAGFDAAGSRYVGRIDADTVLPDTWVENVKQYYEDSERATDMITGGTYFYNKPLPRTGRLLHQTVYFKLNHLLLGYPNLFGSNMVFPAAHWQLLRRHACQREDVHEDIDLSMHANSLGMPIHYLPHLTVGTALRGMVYQRYETTQRFSMWKRTAQLHREYREPALKRLRKQYFWD